MTPINDTTRNKVLAYFRKKPLTNSKELQTLTGLHRRSVFRVIAELRERGYEIQSDNSGYKYIGEPVWDDL